MPVNKLSAMYFFGMVSLNLPKIPEEGCIKYSHFQMKKLVFTEVQQLVMFRVPTLCLCALLPSCHQRN